MNPQPERICPGQPLRGVRLAAGDGRASAVVAAELLRSRYEEGVRDGEKKLREQLLRQRSELLSLQQGVLHSLEQTLPRTRADCETALVELALEVARRIIVASPVTADAVAGAIREALDQLQEAQDILVLLHPEDLELLGSVNAPVLLASVGGEKVRFSVSPEVTRGGCVVQTRFGSVDARREAKFELIKKELQA